jgi:8-oxo-dGTP pyrophosphatase MutT (NUDIX family)
MIFEEKPNGFNPKFESVGTILEQSGKILLLLRQKKDSVEGNTWTGPGGKVEFGEHLYDSMLREIQEETGIIVKRNKLIYLGEFYVKYPNFDFIHHVFSVSLDEKQDVKLDPKEHMKFKWVYPEEALKHSLMLD